MDHFGIGAAMQAMAQIYTQSARRSGRSTSLVESLKDGDRVIFEDPREARRVEGLCKDRGVTIEWLVVDPRDPKGVFGRAPSEGRTIFDHGWVESFYLQALRQAAKAIDHWQREASGYGEAHRETRRRAEEMARWRFVQPPEDDDVPTRHPKA